MQSDLSSLLKIAVILFSITIANIYPASTQGATEDMQKQVEEVTELNPRLALEVSISVRERSKDTHGRSRSVSIRDSQLTYSSRHTGFNPREDINKTAILDNDQTEKLIAYIMEHNLNRNIKEFKKEAGLGTSISLSTKIQIGDAITEVNVSGAYNDWQKTRQNKPPSNLDNLDYYHDINALLMFMRSRLGISVIEP